MPGKFICVVAALAAADCLLGAAETPARVELIPYSDAKAIFAGLPVQIPDALRSLSSEERSAIWSQWLAERNREIRGRLEQG